jgi:hypothetical protein
MLFRVWKTTAGFLFPVVLLLAGGIGRAYTEKHAGKSSGSVKSAGDGSGFGTLTQAFRADAYRGKRLRMSAYVKTDGVERQSGLWMRIDGKAKTGLAFDNMMRRPIKGTTDWKKYEVVLDVPDDAEEIYFGFLVAGKRQGWVDDIAFDVVNHDVPSTGLKTQSSNRAGELIENLPKEPTNLDFEE